MKRILFIPAFILIIGILLQSCALFKKENKANQRLHDIWTTTSMNKSPLNRMVTIPRLEINLSENKIFGNDGCNDFTASIKTATKADLEFNAIALTERMCIKVGVEDEFNKAMNAVKGYELEGLNLILTDSHGNEVLSFLKVD
jgi:heat shock protein HslJ